MGRGGDKLCTVVFAAMSLAAAIVASALLGVSFDTLQPGDMALLFDRNSGKLHCDRLYGADRNSGSRRFFVGLGQGFTGFRFPLAAQTVRFSNRGRAQSGLVEARTMEGAVVTMEMSLQYQLPRTAPGLCAVLYTYGNDYERFFVNYVRGVARDVMGGFLVRDMWERRAAVGSAVRSAVQTEVNARLGTFVAFQLLSLDIPQGLQDEIENTTIQFQRIGQAQLNLQKENVTAITRQLQARVTGTITVLNSTFAANATLIDATARAAVLNLTSVAEASSYNAFKSGFTLTNQQVLTLAWLDALSSTNADRVFVSTDVPPLAKPNLG